MHASESIYGDQTHYHDLTRIEFIFRPFTGASILKQAPKSILLMMIMCGVVQLEGGIEVARHCPRG